MLVEVDAEPAGDNCAAGGELVQTGMDLDGSGLLDEGEVLTSSYICAGLDGADGADGEDGSRGCWSGRADRGRRWVLGVDRPRVHGLGLDGGSTGRAPTEDRGSGVALMGPTVANRASSVPNTLLVHRS